MNLQLITRRVPTRLAVRWILDTFVLLRRCPSLIGLSLLMYLVMLIGSMLPVANFIVPVVWPVFISGFYQCVVLALQNKTPPVETLFSVFSEPQARKNLMLLGCLRLLLLVPVAFLNLPTIDPNNMNNVQIDLDTLLVLLGYFAIYTMVFAYAEPIVYFLGERRLTAVLRASFAASTKNMWPLTVYSLLLFAGLFVVVQLLVMLAHLVPILATIGVLALLILIVPVVLISFFLSFRDCFVLTPAQSTAETVPSDTFEV
jgi:hypothetical protein